MNVVYQWLATSLFWLATVTMFIGFAFVLFPGRMNAWAGKLNVWIATDRYVKVLDSVQSVERSFYRHHRIFGALIAAGGCYVVYALWNAALPMHRLPVIANPAFSEWIYHAAHLVLIAFNILAVVVGVLIFIRPSLLKGVEEWGNRWISSEPVVQQLDSQHFMDEKKVLEHARIFGFMVLLGSSYIFWRTGGSITS